MFPHDWASRFAGTLLFARVWFYLHPDARPMAARIMLAYANVSVQLGDQICRNIVACPRMVLPPS